MSRRLKKFSRSADKEEFLDAWSRTEPHYRRRAVILLLVTGALFAGLCLFTFWLRTGSYGPFDGDAYRRLMWRSINPIGGDQDTLVDFLLFPISVEHVPAQMVIMGLLLGSLASIPILIGILYRLPFALPFIAMIAFLAAMPWYGVTILIGCVAASHPLLRLKFRYASATLGLLPVVIYFVMATREPGSAYATATPFRFNLYAPWVLAVLASCVICGIAIAIATLINFRPGGVAPVLAVLFALPVILFHTYVGRDELEYRLLENRFGPNSVEVFRNLDVGRLAAQRAEKQWKQSQAETFDELMQRERSAVMAEAFDRLAESRQQAVAACETFLERFGNSRYVPSVLFLQARAIDMRINRAAIARDLTIEHYATVPSRQSEPVWRSLVEKFPADDVTAVASNRLAELRVAEGRIDAAAAVLDAFLKQFERPAVEAAVASPLDAGPSLLRRAPASSTLGIDVLAEWQRARRLAELLTLGGGESPRGFDPSADDLGVLSATPRLALQALFSLDPNHPAFADQLNALAIVFPRSAIRPAVAARRMRLDPMANRRVEQLTALCDKYAGAAGSAELMVVLGEALKEAGQAGEAARVLERVRREFPTSCWADEARERLMSVTLFAWR